MTVEPGTSVLHYEVSARIGKGGMGEVFRATDTKLGRDVAIKILPEEFTLDDERVARFQREARLLASLSHPHIASIYGVEDVDGLQFLVMELAAGENLSDRLARGPIPIDEAVEIALQIAQALEVAHDQGIVHRDLKPANVKVDSDNQVQVLDFGLAKAFDDEFEEGDVSNSPTMVRAATHQGVILGTAGYMSPEQARGKSVDERADIWAFGVVLWEMITGRRLFSGTTMSDTLASVLKEDPDWKLLPPETPAAIRRLLRRCLNRNPKDRLRDIGDARLELIEALAPPDEPQADSSAPTTRS
ncbi:MAG: serine/threonine-protein kinase, partial [Thermoanaerobaculia bacterium]|nr:serine/threonine-protein kinase [Thermoanaerobaculia bacterium]